MLAADNKAFLVSLLAFQVSSAVGGLTSSAAVSGGGHPLSVPASASLLRARGSPNHSCGSDPDLPPVTPK